MKIVNKCAKLFRFKSLAAPGFQAQQQQQQPSKRLRCHSTAVAHKPFPLVTSTNGASPGGFVRVCTCARRINSVIHNVLKDKPVCVALWEVLPPVCTVSESEVFNRFNIVITCLDMEKRAGGRPYKPFPGTTPPPPAPCIYPLSSTRTY